MKPLNVSHFNLAVTFILVFLLAKCQSSTEGNIPAKEEKNDLDFDNYFDEIVKIYGDLKN